MAEDKKSFVLYADMLFTVEKMTKEKAGELFMTILEYVNDRDPVVQDVMVDLVFEPIKRQLKRDLKKYEGVKVSKSESGAMGNLKRWHIDLYNQVLSREIDLTEAIIIAEDRKAKVIAHRKTSHSDDVRSHRVAPDRTVSQSIANVAVTVNDTVTVTDNDSKGDLALKKFIEFSSEEIWVADTAALLQTTRPNFLILLRKFLDLQKAGENLAGRGRADLKQHFISWGRIQISNGAIPEMQTKPLPGQKLPGRS